MFGAKKLLIIAMISTSSVGLSSPSVLECRMNLEYAALSVLSATALDFVQSLTRASSRVKLEEFNFFSSKKGNSSRAAFVIAGEKLFVLTDSGSYFANLFIPAKANELIKVQLNLPSKETLSLEYQLSPNMRNLWLMSVYSSPQPALYELFLKKIDIPAIVYAKVFRSLAVYLTSIKTGMEEYVREDVSKIAEDVNALGTHCQEVIEKGRGYFPQIDVELSPLL